MSQLSDHFSHRLPGVYFRSLFRQPHLVHTEKGYRNLAPALDKCIDTLEKGFYETPAIWVRKRRNRERIPISEILYLEQVGHQTKVVKLHETMVCRQTPKELLSTLEPHTFIHCHQSFWVNTSKIFSLVGNTFHLIDGSVILISRTRKKEATQLFTEAFSKNMPLV